MTTELAAIYVIDLLPTATEQSLKAMIPTPYHDYLNVFDPEAPLTRLPRHNQATTSPSNSIPPNRYPDLRAPIT